MASTKPTFPELSSAIFRRVRARRDARHVRRARAHGLWSLFAAADNKQPRAGLRHEKSGVHNESAKTIPSVHHGFADGGEVGAAMRGQRAIDIFKHDDARRPALLLQTAHQKPEGPKSARAPTSQSGIVARKRKILAGKRGPGEIGPAGKLLWAERGDVFDDEGVRPQFAS